MAEPIKNPDPKPKSKKMTTDDYLNKFMTEYGIDNPMIRSAILGDIQAEGGTKGTPEMSWRNTAVERIREKFGARVEKYTDEELEKIKKDDVKFFDMVYGPEAMPFYTDRKKGAWNPGNDQKGDGYKYRGRGLNQLTFKSQYARATKDLQKRGYDVDLVKNPELLDSDPEIQALVAVNFLYKRLQSMPSEKKEQYKTNDWTQVTSPTVAADIISNANAGWGKNPNAEYIENVRGATIDNLPEDFAFGSRPMEEVKVATKGLNKATLPITKLETDSDPPNIIKEYDGPSYKRNVFGKIKEVKKKTFGGQFENFNIMKKYKMQEGGQQQPTPEEMAMMQQQQAQQGAAPQQGAPQGQDPAMQQMMQMVQQMIQQGAQPADIAAELLGQQVPPEAIMQVFVEMGLPEQEAQAAIQQAMQGGPAQEGAPQGQPSPEEMAAMQQQQGQQPMMDEGGLIGDQDKLDYNGDGTLSKSDFASLRQAEYGDDVKESINRLQRKTITQLYPTPSPAPEPFTIDDLQQLKNTYGDVTIGANGVATDANGRVVGKNIRPEFHTTGKFTMGADPKTFSNNAGTPSMLRESGEFMPIGAMKNMKAGGSMFKKLMKKAWGGDLTMPGATSEDYVSERAAGFVNAIKQNTALASLNESMNDNALEGKRREDLPSAKLGGLPKFNEAGDTKYIKNEAGEYVEYVEPAKASSTNSGGFTPEMQAYLQQQMQNQNSGGFSGYNPYMSNMTAGYRDPRQYTAWDEIQRGLNPFARMIANSGRTFSQPSVRGFNLPGNMSGMDMLQQMQGMSGTTGTTADGTPYRIGSGERYVEKDGTFLKNLNPFVRRKPTRRGVRYNIDYGTGLTDGTQEGEAPDDAAVNEGSGALSRRDMLNDLSREEKKSFRKLKRQGVSVNDAYQRQVDTRGGTEDPAQVEDAAMATFDPTDPDDMDLDNNAGLQEIANPAAEVDPALADEGSQEAQLVGPANEPGREGFNADSDGNAIPDYLQYENTAPGMREAEEMNNSSIERMPLADDAVDPNLPVSSQNQTRKNQREQAKQQERDSFSEFGKRTTRQLQRKGVLDAQGNVVPVEGAGTPPPPTVEEMQARSAKIQQERDQAAAMEQNAIDETSRQQARELFEGQNPIASSDPSRVKGRTDLLKRVANEIDPGLNARGVVKDVPGVTDVQPQVTEEVDEMQFMSPVEDRYKGMGQAPFQPNMMAADGMTYGGGVSPQALANAVNLINRAFGGQAYSIPQATYGNMGMRMSNDSANVFSPEQIEALKKMQADNSGTGTIDIEQEQGFEIDKPAAGQSGILGAKGYTFFNEMGENRNNLQAAEFVQQSPLSGQVDSFASLNKGLYDQQGVFKPDQINSQVKNVTSNVGYGAFGGQPQMMMYGGQYYQIGGDVDLDEEQLRRFEEAGFILSRM